MHCVDGTAELQLVTRLPRPFQIILVPLYKRHTLPRRTRVRVLSLSLSCVPLSLLSHVSLSFSLVHLSVHVSFSRRLSPLQCPLVPSRLSLASPPAIPSTLASQQLSLRADSKRLRLLVIPTSTSQSTFLRRHPPFCVHDH